MTTTSGYFFIITFAIAAAIMLVIIFVYIVRFLFYRKPILHVDNMTYLMAIQGKTSIATTRNEGKAIYRAHNNGHSRITICATRTGKSAEFEVLDAKEYDAYAGGVRQRFFTFVIRPGK